MGFRRKSREMALQLLYMAEHFPESESIDIWKTYHSFFEVDENLENFSRGLFEGVALHRSDLNKLIESYSDHWRVSRMSYIDRNILRLALYEMIYLEDIPVFVSIDEAIEVAKKYGSEDSPAFINGILDKIFKKEILAA